MAFTCRIVVMIRWINICVKHLEECLAHSKCYVFADSITIIKFSIPRREKVAYMWKYRPLP